MIAYLIKSALCLVLLLAAYHLLLENEAIHRFKRYYLLGSLVFSLAIPFISINVKMPQSPVAEMTKFTPDAVHLHDDTPELVLTSRKNNVTQPKGSLWQDYLWGAYTLVAAVLLIRFALNLTSLLSKTRSNERIEIHGGILVLVEEAIIPNSFLRYIFVNREEYLQNKLETGLLMHELVHVRQKHSLDIIFIELLKALMWFNPAFILYKKAIQLNHEFLADEGVIKVNANIRDYQTLLLTKVGLQHNYALTSNFNYSVTKKRLIMMNHTTTKLRAMLKASALLPLLTLLIVTLCVKAQAQQATQQRSSRAKAIEPAPKTTAPIVVYQDHYPLDSVFIHYYSKKGGTKAVKSLSGLPPKEQAKFLAWTKKTAMTAKKTPTTAQFEKWKDGNTYGVWLDGKQIKNEILDAYKATDLVMYYSSKLYGPAKKGRIYSYQVDLYTPAYYQKVKEEIDASNNTKTRADIFAMVK